ELEVGSPILKALNYQDPYADFNEVRVQAGEIPVSILALISEFRDDPHVQCVTNPDDETCSTDGVVVSDSQSIERPLQNHLSTKVADIVANVSTNPNL